MQNYSNHVRWNPLVHFVVAPLLIFNLIWQIVRFSQERTWDHGEAILVAVTLILLNIGARLQALKVQNRVVRLEEKLRYREVLPPELAVKAAELPLSRIIPLRFASDAELPGLIELVLNNELSTAKEIKMRVKEWRADDLRA